MYCIIRMEEIVKMFDGYTEKDVIMFHVKDFMQLAKDIETSHNELIDKRNKMKEELETIDKQIISYKITFEVINELFKKGQKLDLDKIASSSVTPESASKIVEQTEYTATSDSKEESTDIKVTQ